MEQEANPKVKNLKAILKPVILDYNLLNKDSPPDFTKELEISFGVNVNGILLVNNMRRIE